MPLGGLTFTFGTRSALGGSGTLGQIAATWHNWQKSKEGGTSSPGGWLTVPRTRTTSGRITGDRIRPAAWRATLRVKTRGVGHSSSTEHSGRANVLRLHAHSMMLPLSSKLGDYAGEYVRGVQAS